MNHPILGFVQAVVKWTIILALCSMLLSGVLGAH